MKIGIGAANAAELRVGDDADHLIGELAKDRYLGGGRHRDRHDDPRRTPAFERDERCLHRGAGRKTVVHDDCRFALGIGSAPVAQIAFAAALHFRDLPLGFPFKIGLVDARSAYHLLVYHPLGRVALDDGCKRYLRIARRSDLAYQDQIQRHPQSFSDFRGDRNPAARKGENHRRIEAALHQLRCEPASGIVAVREWQAPLCHVRTSSMQMFAAESDDG